MDESVQGKRVLLIQVFSAILVIAFGPDKATGRFEFLIYRVMPVVVLLPSFYWVYSRLRAKHLILVSPFLIVSLFEIYVGSYSLIRDFCLFLACAVGAASLSAKTRTCLIIPRSIFNLSHSALIYFGGRFLLLTWLTVYLADWIAVGAVQNFRRRENLLQPSPIALSLSGGGYRAALFHAGVLKSLGYIGIQPKALTTVSGGSIIGAFYALGGDPDDFLRLVYEKRFNLTREIFAPWYMFRQLVSARVPGTSEGWIPTSHFTRTNVQASILDNVFLKGLTVSEYRRVSRPGLLLCTTDIGSGDMLGISPDFMILRKRYRAAQRDQFINMQDFRSLEKPQIRTDFSEGILNDYRLSTLVAASGAFPGALSPIRIDRYDLGDGGIADNLGLILTNDAAREAKSLREFDRKSIERFPTFSTRHDKNLVATEKWLIQAVIVSDGSAIPIYNPPTSILSQLSSALDAIYLSSGGSAQAFGPNQNLLPAILLSPGMFLTDSLNGSSIKDIQKEDISVRSPFKLFHDKIEVITSEAIKNHQVLGEEHTKGFRNYVSHDIRNLSRPPNFDQLEIDDLKFLATILPRKNRAEALTLIGYATELRESQLTQTYAPPNRLETIFLKNSELYRLFEKQIRNDIVVFLGTSTLKDVFDEEEAEAIFRLGAIITVLNKVNIHEILRANSS